MRTSQFAPRAQDEFAPGKAFANVIVRLPLQHQRHPLRGKSAKRLSRRPAHPEAQVWFGQRLTATQQRQLARQTRAQTAVFVPYRHVVLERFACDRRRERGFYPSIIERWMI